MQPPAKKAVVLASLDGRALKLQVGAKTTARKALEADNKAAPVPATGLERKGGAPLRLDAPLGPQVAEGEVVVLAELLRVAGPETIAARCTPRALARAAFLESTDDDFGRVRAALRARGFACNEELCEQRLSLLLPRSARLLTIGAGFGATCMVADALLDDPTRQVVAGGPFDAVLADCEGAFVDVVRDFPELLDRASWVCVEWDQPSNRNWVAEVRPALLRAGLAPLDCGDRRCACDEPRFAPSFRAQGAPTFHEVFVRTGCVRCAD
ncbi:hypothetical protein JL722_13514 [Aureococcus anophagefferens]|nr:hypothetical protein JL722_13514 [Aureococcus anophagefferens]